MKTLHLYSKNVNVISNVYIEFEKHKNTVKTVILWCLEEQSINWLKPEQQYELETYFKNLDVKFIVYTNRHVPYYWAFHTVYNNLYQNKTLPIEHGILKRTFVTLNGKGWGHRCQFIDKLAEFNLLKSNYYSWNLWQNDMVKSTYEFKYFDGKIKHLDNPKSGDYYCVPKEFYHSLFSVICETSLHNIFFTEKLWQAIYHKRPFVVYGARGYHQALRDLGFKMFEPVINYSFDHMNHQSKRLDELCCQLKSLQRYSKSLQSVRDYFQPTLEHNFQNMLRLLDQSELPGYIHDKSCYYKPTVQINTLQKYRKLIK